MSLKFNKPERRLKADIYVARYHIIPWALENLARFTNDPKMVLPTGDTPASIKAKLERARAFLSEHDPNNTVTEQDIRDILNS